MDAETPGPSTSATNDSSPNVRDLAKKFESMSPIKKPVVKKTQTVRMTKQKPAKPPVLNISVTPIHRKRSSKKRRQTGKLSNSVTELRITTGPTTSPTEMAIKRKTSSKMKKSKSADANISAYLTSTALKCETPRAVTTQSKVTDRPPMSSVSSVAKPAIPPKPKIIADKTTSVMSEQSATRVSQMIQKRQEELSKLSINLEPKKPAAPPVKNTNQQRPKIPPPLPASTTNAEKPVDVPLAVRTMSSSFKNRRRVVRKPSYKPPPAPPIKPKVVDNEDQMSKLIQPEITKMFEESETSGQSETSLESSSRSIRCRLPDGTLVPDLPNIPAPLPPESDFVFEDSGLYEEIEYAFMESEQRLKSTEQIIPTNGYNPKFAKKSAERSPPPEFYRSSHPDLHREETRDYAETLVDEKQPNGTQTLGRSSAMAIAAALRSEKFFKTPSTDPMASSVIQNSIPSVGTWSKKTGKKAASTLDVEKISQLKTGFQSKMDWLKQKVTAKKASDLFGSNGRHRESFEHQPSSANVLDPRFYGDDWSSDEENEELEDVGEEPLPFEDTDDQCAGLVTQKYERIDFHSETPPSKSTYNSLLAEIESAYAEGRRQITEQPTKREMSENPEHSLSLDSQSPKSTSVNELRPDGFQVNTGKRFSLSTNQLDSSFDTQSCCSSSAGGQDEELNMKNLTEELQTSTVTTEDSESLSDLERKSLYESQLPVQQPLYQIYMLQEQKMLNDDQLLKPPNSIETVLHAPLNDEHEADSVCDSNDTDDLGSISVRRQSSTASTDSGRGVDVASSRVTSNTSMRRERLTAGSAFGSQRTLWSELSEVQAAGLLTNLDDKSRKLQEAFFEVITSEASYLRSLNVLISNFFEASELQGPKKAMSIITSSDRKHLFSNILSIRDCSEHLLRDLESRLKESLVLTDVCDILSEHFDKHFYPYVLYCSNQIYQDRTLKRLKATNSQFLSCIKKIEMRRELHGLDLRSFLILPMQRATKYRLLLFAILDYAPPNSQQVYTASRALNLANMLVQNCNEGARMLERTEQLLEIERRLVYKSADLKRIPLVQKTRHVVKSGQLTQFVEQRYRPKLNMLQSKQKSRQLYLFLFNDLILIASKKANGTFSVKDYAYRRYIETEPIEAHSHKIPISVISSLPPKSHLFFLILMQNARQKQSEYLLNTESETDRERWLNAIRPPVSNPGERIYASWDCPRVIARDRYDAMQEDEISLEQGDLIDVLRKMPDGWFFGEKIRDNTQGWFPSSYCQQIMNDHVKANAYRNRLRIMQAATELQQSTRQDKRISLAAIHAPPIKDRLRRLSNPKAFFNN